MEQQYGIHAVVGASRVKIKVYRARVSLRVCMPGKRHAFLLLGIEFTIGPPDARGEPIKPLAPRLMARRITDTWHEIDGSLLVYIKTRATLIFASAD